MRRLPALKTLAHPFSLAYACTSVPPCFISLRREGQAVQEQAESLIVLSRDQGFPMFVAWGTILRGWALAEQGTSGRGDSP